MWSVGSKRSADVYIGTKRVMYAPAGISEDDAAGVEPRSWSVEGFADALRVLDEQVLASADHETIKDWRVWLSAGIAKPFLLNVPAKISSSELRRIAEGSVAERDGVADSCELWIEPRKGANSVIVVALPKSLLPDLLNRFTTGKGRRLRSLRPWWSDVLRLALTRNPEVRLVAVQDCDSLTMLSGQRQAFDGVQSLHPVYDEATAEAALARKRLALDLDNVQVMHFRLQSNWHGGAVQRVEPPLAPFLESIG